MHACRAGQSAKRDIVTCEIEMAVQFEVQAMVRGYHKYKDIWEAEVGGNLVCDVRDFNL